MKINDKIHGFKVCSAVTLDGGETLWKMEHEKTGALLAYLDNGEENKLFSIGFKTIPWDDTGVFHILEHSVLGGSDNYPVKEPFLDLLKSSMNTFLNAMTFPDKTMYPVSSRNEQDFLNLASVYLDAVFCPAIYKQPNIFYQEGWHYELHEGDSAPIYKGVVFNEMKGAYSSVENMLDKELCKILFKDNCYKYSSGGDPEFIPELTYEDFIAAHKKFYHPSNAKIYLDGSVPLEKLLKIIDEKYLSGYGKEEMIFDIPMQEHAPAAEQTVYYEIGKDEDTKGKVQINIGKILCSFEDRKKILAFDILSTYLAGSNASPLKRAILEAGLAQDIEVTVNSGIAQPYINIRVKNTELDKKDEINETIDKVVKEIIKNGIDREELEANINELEFSRKDIEEPKGIHRAIYAMTGWLYGGEPEDYLLNDELIASLREELGDCKYFEEILSEMLLRDHGKVTIVALPSSEIGEKVRKAEKARLEKAYSEWTNEDKNKIIKATDSLIAWQNSVDTPEQLASLPMLSLSDIEEKPAKTETEIKDVDGVTVLYHPVASNGIVHAKLYFAVNDIPMEKLPELSFLCDLFTALPTEKYTTSELQKEIKKNIGKLNFSVSHYPIEGECDTCRVFIKTTFSVLEKNLSLATALVCEILKHTRFDDTDLIKETLLQSNEGLYQMIIERGHTYASGRALKNFSAFSAVQEKLNGYDTYSHLSELSKNFDARIGDFCDFAKNITENILVANRLTLSETASEAHSELLGIIPLLGKNNNDSPEFMTPELSKKTEKEAIQIPAGISFIGYAGNLSQYGEKFSGALAVLSGILTYGYLWNEIRVKGGAYGCGFAANAFGNIMFRTFRDPSPIRSLEICRKTSDYINELCQSDEAIEKYIISSIASSEPLKSPSEKGAAADGEYFSGTTYEQLCSRRAAMLSLKKPDLLSACPIFDKMKNEASECIIGHEGIISQLDGTWKIYKL